MTPTSGSASRVPGRDEDTADAWLMPTIGGDARPFMSDRGLARLVSGSRAHRLPDDRPRGSPLRRRPQRCQCQADLHRQRRGFTTTTRRGRPTDASSISSAESTNPFRHGRLANPVDRRHGRAPDELSTRASHTLRFSTTRTLLFTASRPDGSGSGLYAMDVDRRIPHAVSFGLEEYVSVAASADGRRLVATVANPTSHLWTAPISDHVVDDSAVSRFSLPAVRASAPRFGPGYVLFLSSKGGADGLWKFKDGVATELWRGSEGSVTAAPAISPDGTRICFVVRDGEAVPPPRDGGGWHGRSSPRRSRSTSAMPRPGLRTGSGSPSSPPRARSSRCSRSPSTAELRCGWSAGVNYDPVWSPDGRFIAYSEHHGGPTFQLKAVTLALGEWRSRLG